MNLRSDTAHWKVYFGDQVMPFSALPAAAVAALIIERAAYEIVAELPLIDRAVIAKHMADIACRLIELEPAWSQHTIGNA